ncbi:hypothetical protein H257_04696 [Aphanomyces astaci]|uniref:Uncharacterized protein n=1 Tax=Aphanomyces astaci TaxID=112090 RepID=W4GUC7_APHAT|nr:hypothetical protein H257_04696 [Aphanomyces astaci]ETV82926.1 hypothetical protein H257_04696 [Aphanomyces astaci]|eukprot:XP_009827597.1 hypothetical protein H257_04696 [Aphanomyces astaci]
MTLDECRICLSRLENVFRLLNIKIREAEDDEVYTWYLESYLVGAGSREYLALNQKLVKMISLLHYVVKYSQTYFRESRAALWIHENTDPSAPRRPSIKNESVTPSRRSSAQASIGTRDTMQSADPVLPQTTVDMEASMLEKKLDQKMEGIRSTLEALMASLPTTALPRPSPSQSQNR